MAYALEVRSPFLDYRFVEFSQRIPTEWKVDFFKSKKFMRKLIQGIVPDKIIHRGKRGFIPPLQDWILDSKYEPFLRQASDYLKDLSPELFLFFNKRVFAKKNKLYNLYKIRLFLFGKWFDKWIDEPNFENASQQKRSTNPSTATKMKIAKERRQVFVLGTGIGLKFGQPIDVGD
jgi:asparagine synthase (glutamine-hydrolysing)